MERDRFIFYETQKHTQQTTLNTLSLSLSISISISLIYIYIYEIIYSGNYKVNKRIEVGALSLARIHNTHTHKYTGRLIWIKMYILGIKTQIKESKQVRLHQSGFKTLRFFSFSFFLQSSSRLSCFSAGASRLPLKCFLASSFCLFGNWFLS